jgi:signal transduction histidine kinase
MPEPDTADPIVPMLAVDGALPLGSAWAFEFVWDGLRVLLYLSPGRTRMFSASGRSITSGYPELAPLSRLADRHGPLVLDGKIVTADQFGRPSTAPLWQRMNNPKPSESLVRRAPVLFYLADVLHADGRDTMALPFRDRRHLLTGFDLAGLPAKLPPCFVDTDGRTVLHAAVRHGIAGVVAKRLDSSYQPGRRTRAWVQTLPRHTQPVLIGGWLPAESGSDSVPVALLVGVVDPAGTLRYLGTVRTGLDRAARAELSDPLARLAAGECPFADAPLDELAGARWLTPQLVGEVSYRRLGVNGRLRHASWLGVRPDAHPASVRGPLPLPARQQGAGPAGGVRSASAELAALDEAVRLAQAEVRALRAQISPHFLYNALTTIATYVRTDPDRARELLHDFAEYTRYSFRSNAEATTLGAELANANHYLALEGARFGDRLRVEREISSELHDVRLPFRTVGSLVENAVQHGIEGTPRGGTLRIRAERVDATHCLLTIADDGLGMDPNRLTETIADVRERLAAAPGPANALDVVTAPDIGTTVTVRLPMSAVRLD